jgi:hypothetical protein
VRFWPTGWTTPPIHGTFGRRQSRLAEDFYLSRPRRYDGAVFGNVGRRLVEGVVSLFALLGFLYVPLGHHTGYEHVRAVLSTPAASAAIEDVTQAALGLRLRAIELVTGRASTPPPVSELDRSNQGTGRQPRPVPPKLK